MRMVLASLLKYPTINIKVRRSVKDLSLNVKVENVLLEQVEMKMECCVVWCRHNVYSTLGASSQ